MTRARPVVRVIASDPEPSAGSLPWRRSKGALAWVEAWPLAHWAGVERLRRQLARFSFRAPGQGAIVPPMVNAIILLNVQREAILEVAERLAGLEGIAEVYSVAGRYDLAVIARARDNEELANLITGRMLKESHITHSETLFSFRVYSRYDLERMFSIGLE